MNISDDYDKMNTQDNLEHLLNGLTLLVNWISVFN